MRAIKPKMSVVAAAACCLIAVSCVSNGPPSANGNTNHAVAGPAKKGGTLVVGINDDVDSLDSALASEEVSQDVMAPMCQGLYYRGASGQPEPQLATSLPQLSDGGKTATITLRSGVAFNDGTTFNAAAVKQSWELGAKLAGSTFVSTLAFIKAIDTPNPRTLVLHLYHPYAPLATELTYMLVASPAQRLKLGAKFATDPVCVGPFKFVSRVPGVSITEAKSNLYYDKTKVNLDDIDFKVITDADAGEAALRTGSIDLYTGVPLTDVAAMQKAPGVRVIYQVGAGWYALAINIANKSGAGKPTAYQQLDTPLAKSAQLRQALALSIDRNVLSQLSSDGLSYPG